MPLLTGLRRDEALGLEWSWFDIERGVLTLPPEAEKTRRQRDELRRRSQSDSMKRVMYRLRGRRSNGLPPSRDKRAKARTAVLPDDVTIHDIRRTVADALLNRVGTSPWIVDHVVLGRPKLLRPYRPTLPLSEAREALRGWGEELQRILGDAHGLEDSAT